MAKDFALDESASVTGRTSSGPITVQPFRYTELTGSGAPSTAASPAATTTRPEVTKAPSTRKGSKPAEPSRVVDSPPTMVLKRPRQTATPSSGGWAARAIDSFVSWNLPLLGSKPVAVQLQALMTLLGLSAVVMVGVVLLNLRAGHLQIENTEKFGQTLMHTQRLAKAAPLALQGQPAALGQLKDSRDQVGLRLSELINVAPASVAGDFAPIAQQWRTVEAEASRIAAAEKSLLAFGGLFKAVADAAPRLTQLTDDFMALKAAAGGRDAALAGQLAASAQRLIAGVLALGSGTGDVARAAGGVARDLPALREYTQQLLSTADGDARTKLQQIAKINGDLQAAFDPSLAGLPIVAQLAGAKAALLDNAEPLQRDLQRVRQSFDAETGRSTGSQIVAGVAAILCIVLVLAMVQVPLRDSRRRAAEAEAQRAEAQRLEQQAKRTNEQNQAAILRLMNELQEVADGNLTVQATVTEDITGAIADSVNYTVEELRALVARINGAAAQVDASSTSARDIATRLMTASEAQSRDIKETGSQVLQMTQNIGEVSRNAGESSKVARVSLEAAERGQRAVYNQIAGMNEIREQIQETAKRIKRLGESSQEIGEIGELISDITEQTNVLALNAAIQAASAGEAGRGFTVVAEEVQRLADRSAEATKQIGALVRAIQTDTQDAVAAMEKSTAGVVEGTKLSDAAGTALADIGRVSRQLADLIEKIAGSTKDQSEAADDVAAKIERILSVNAQTTSGTRDATQSIAELASLARELKESVARFRVS